jgi:hypothetical protein
MYDCSENLTQEVQSMCLSRLHQQLHTCRDQGSLTMELGSLSLILRSLLILMHRSEAETYMLG